MGKNWKKKKNNTRNDLATTSNGKERKRRRCLLGLGGEGNQRRRWEKTEKKIAHAHDLTTTSKEKERKKRRRLLGLGGDGGRWSRVAGEKRSGMAGWESGEEKRREKKTGREEREERGIPNSIRLGLELDGLNGRVGSREAKIVVAGSRADAETDKGDSSRLPSR